VTAVTMRSSKTRSFSMRTLTPAVGICVSRPKTWLGTWAPCNSASKALPAYEGEIERHVGRERRSEPRRGCGIARPLALLPCLRRIEKRHATHPQPHPYRHVGRAIGSRSAAGSGWRLRDEPRAAAARFAATEKPRFPHQEHVTRHNLECVECITRPTRLRLDTPHDAYLAGNGIECQVCHQGRSLPREPQALLQPVNPVTPTDVADETLSAKVVIHRTCWRCHPMREGVLAPSLRQLHGGSKPQLARRIPPPSFRSESERK